MSQATEHPKAYMYRRIVEAKAYIDAHFAERIDLDNVSDQACFSKYHFHRLFKQAFGKTPHQYLTQLRLQQAQTLLSSGNSVQETCFEVGFESLPSFVSLFKKHIGQTPRDFARAHQAQLAEQAEQPLNFVPGCFADSFGWKD